MSKITDRGVKLSVTPVECDQTLKNKYSRVKFNVVTKEVHDEDGKFLGYGRMVDGVLKIENFKRP